MLIADLLGVKSGLEDNVFGWARGSPDVTWFHGPESASYLNRTTGLRLVGFTSQLPTLAEIIEKSKDI